MTQLLDLETKLSILSRNPCHCMVCRQAAQLAKRELAEVSPSGAVLLDLPLGAPEFAAAEQKFRAEEVARLQAVYDLIGRDRCMLSLLPPSEPSTITTIPDLPAPEEWRERIEHYRKHTMKPRLRKDTAEPVKNPRIPGSFVFK